MTALLFTASCERGGEGAGIGPCEGVEAAAATGRPAVNVVLIVNDTMRRDRVGAYGGPARTPTFDAFARDGILFENAYTQSPWTKPAIATLFTSLYPSQHRVATDPQLRNPFDMKRSGPLLETDLLSAQFRTLAEVMHDGGYRTAAFVSNPWMEKRFGFDQGFDVYDDSFARWGTPGDQVSKAGLAWLAERQAGEKFFLYLHYLDSHLPYGLLDRQEVAARAEQIKADRRPLSDQAKAAVQMVPRFTDGRSPLQEGFAPALSLVEMAYDSGLTEFDSALAPFLAGLAAHPAAADTAVIITADHGEALFERGYGNHGTGLFDDEVAIPLAMRLPHARAARPRIDCPVGLVDIMPTLCEYLGLPCPPEAAGVSFVDAGSKRNGRQRYVVSEGVVKHPKHRAIRNAGYKLSWETGPRGGGATKENPYSLFDVAADPGETRDLLLPDLRSERTDRVFEAMKLALPSAVPEYAAPDASYAPIGDETRERLRALGYTDAP